MVEQRDIFEEMIAPLLSWYAENKKSLPWREDPTPYHVWLSEIMLQQTRIEAVIPYYHRFLAVAPTIESLALLSDDVLMKLWEGLGYYSRARNLKKAAMVLMRDYGGELPHTAKELRALSGIGSYTAGAIASIAFGEPEPAVDGNVLRVMTRFYGLRDDILQPTTKKNMENRLRALYPSGNDAGSLTQALMELGENICIPNGTPKCEICPLAAHCVARALALTGEIPCKSPKGARKIEKKTVFLLSCMGKYAICRRPESGLLAGLWEFPNVAGHLSSEEARHYWQKHGIEAVFVTRLADAVHIFTHKEWNMVGYYILCTNQVPGYIYEDAESIRDRYAIPTAFRAYCEAMEKDAASSQESMAQ